MRPPIDKACGEGLMPDSVSALQRLGIEIPPELGRRFLGVRFIENGRQMDGDFDGIHGLAVRRTVLHEKMVARAEACGVTFRWGAPVTGLSDDGVATSTEMIRARWIVGADGARSRVRQWAGLDASTRYRRRYAFRRHYRLAPWSSRMDLHWSNESQAYVTPLGPDQICVAVVSRDPHLRLDAALQAFPALRARIGDATPISAERGATTSMHSLRRVCSGRVALIGDASGGVDAITGEGLGLSFRQATALADAIESGNLRCYQWAHRRLAWRPNFMARGLLMLDGRPWLRRRVLNALQDANLFRRMLRIHTGEAPVRDLVTMGVRLGLKLLESGT
jgi:2-polyprenyl-6-methoxyphenol hydroxylase-like FAD-dependent oxidoreductase